MPLKPMTGFPAIRSSRRPKTRKQKLAKSNAAMREERMKNLAKARKVRQKNLRLKKKASKL